MPAVNVDGILCTTEEELETLLASMVDLPYEQKLYIRNDFYGCPNPNVAYSQVPLLRIQEAVTAAMAFGQKLLIDFRAENVALGVMQDNMTSTLLTKLAPVMDATLSGSLTEAIARIRAIPPEDHDPKYITTARMLAFINKIEAYLGMPLSTEV